MDRLPLLHKLAPRDRRAVLLGLAVLLPALLWVAAVRPYRAYAASLQERIVAERALLEREHALLARAASLPDEVAAAEAAAQQAELRLVRAPNEPLAEAELTSYLESVATASRVLLKGLRGVEPRRGEDVSGPLRPIRQAVTGESDLEGIVLFLHRLETSPLLVRVTQFTLEPVFEGTARNGGRAAPSGLMQFSLVVEAFVPAEPTLPPSAGTEPGS